RRFRQGAVRSIALDPGRAAGDRRGRAGARLRRRARVLPAAVARPGPRCARAARWRRRGGGRAMAPPHRRNLVFVAAAFALGGLANLIFGQSPGTGAAQLPPEAEWKMPGPDVPDLAVLDAGWEARAPWGAAPKPPEAAATPPPPPPAPVGIVR